MRRPRLLSGGCLIGCAVAVEVMVLGGCGSDKNKGVQPQAGALVQGVDGNYLGAQVSSLLNRTYADLIGTASDIQVKTDDRAVREACLLWKIRVARGVEAISQVQDVRARFVLAWVAIVQMRQEFTTGPSRSIFGNQQAVAVAAVRQLEQAAQDAGRAVLSKERMEAATDDVEQMAGQNIFSLRRLEMGQDPTAPLAQARQMTDLQKILSVPMSPITGLQGVGDTPAAITQVARETRYASDVVGRLPQELRWQAELLLIEAEDSGAVSQMLRQVTKIQQTFAVLEQTARQLPADLSEQSRRVIDALAQQQPKLDQSLAQAQAVLAQAQRSIQEGNQLLGGVRESSQSLQKTIVAYQAAVVETRKLMADISALTGPPQPPSTQPAGREEDGSWAPAHVQAAAMQLESAAAEIRGLLGDIRQAPSAQPTRIDATLDRLDGLVNAIAIRLALLAGLVFVLALAYRRLRGPSRRQTPAA